MRTTGSPSTSSPSPSRRRGAPTSSSTSTRARPEEELDHAIRQIVAGAVAPGEVVDVFEAAGLQKPDISLLSDEFLAEVRELPQRNLAVELLRKLLNDEVKARTKRNVVRGRAFSEMLEATIRRYRNRTIETAQVIEEQATLTVLEQAELLGLEVAAEPVVLPFRRLDDGDAEPYVNCIPLTSLAAAAGGFGETQAPEA